MVEQRDWPGLSGTDYSFEMHPVGGPMTGRRLDRIHQSGRTAALEPGISRDSLQQGRDIEPLFGIAAIMDETHAFGKSVPDRRSR